MGLTSIARRLCAVTEPEGTVATVVLDLTKSKLPPHTRVFLRDRIMKPLATAARSSPAGKTIEKLSQRIRRYVEAEVREETNGLILVAGATTWEAVELLVPMPNFFHLGPAPYLAPFLEAEARAPRAYVARFNMRSGLLQELHLGAWHELGGVEASGTPADYEHVISGRTTVIHGSTRGLGTGIGGGRRDRFDQTLLEATAAMVRDAARQVGVRDAKAPSAAVLVFGDREAFPEFRDHLPLPMRARARYVGPVSRRERELREKAVAELSVIAHDRQEAEILEFHMRRAEGQLVALGPEDVWRQIAQGKVVRLFLDAYNPLPGSRCLSCGTRASEAAENCSVCGGGMRPVSLTQEAVHDALKHPPLSVTFVPRPSKWLEDIGGMAALLAKKGVRTASGEAR